MGRAEALPWAGHKEPPSLLGGSAMASGRSVDHWAADQAWTKHLIRSRWPQVLICSSLAELERDVRVGVERVGERDPVVAVRDIALGYENRRQLLPG